MKMETKRAGEGGPNNTDEGVTATQQCRGQMLRRAPACDSKGVWSAVGRGDCAIGSPLLPLSAFYQLFVSSEPSSPHSEQRAPRTPTNAESRDTTAWHKMASPARRPGAAMRSPQEWTPMVSGHEATLPDLLSSAAHGPKRMERQQDCSPERHTKRRKCVVLLSATDGQDCHGAPIESCSAKAGQKSPSPPHCSRVIMVQKAEGLTISPFIKSHLN